MNVTTVDVVLVGEGVVFVLLSLLLSGDERHTDGGGDGHGDLALG